MAQTSNSKEIDIQIDDVVVKVIETTTYGKQEYIEMIQAQLSDTVSQKSAYITAQDSVIVDLQNQLNQLGVK